MFERSALDLHEIFYYFEIGVQVMKERTLHLCLLGDAVNDRKSQDQ